MATLARMQYHQRQAFQADSDDEEDAIMNAPGPNNPDTRYADDDGLDGLDAEEAEQERLLSEQFGEAGEAPSAASDKRKTTTDQDIAAELAGEVRKAKKSRPTLQPAHLIGPNGLNRIKNEFHDQVKYRGVDRAKLQVQGKGQGKGGKKKPTREQLKRAELNAAAAYSRDLVGAYRSFCRDLFPSLAFEDTVARIENLSSKKEVKDYVEVMREDVRRQHLVGIYGAPKTDRMLSELESNLVGGAEGYGGDDGDDGQHGAAAAAAAVVNPYGAGAGNAPVVEEEEEEVPPASPARDYRGVTRFSQRANLSASEPMNSADGSNEEEEEEVEASFDEDVSPTADADDDAAAFAAADEGDKQDQNDGEAQEKDDEEEELEFVDAAPKEKEFAEDIVAKSTEENNDDHKENEDEEEQEEQLFFDATQPSQEDASPKELLGQETPSPQSTPEDSTPPSSTEKAAQAPGQEEDQQESENDLPETEAFGMPNEVNMMEEDIPTQHVAHDDDDGEEGDDSEELVMDATQETLTNVLPAMTAPDTEENGEGEEQMSLEH